MRENRYKGLRKDCKAGRYLTGGGCEPDLKISFDEEDHLGMGAAWKGSGWGRSSTPKTQAQPLRGLGLRYAAHDHSTISVHPYWLSAAKSKNSSMNTAMKSVREAEFVFWISL